MSEKYSTSSDSSSLSTVKLQFTQYTKTHCSNPASDTPKNYISPTESVMLEEEVKPMSGHITRDELDSKLSAVEARMDLRVEKFSNSMQQIISELRVERANRDAQVMTAIAEVDGKLEPLKGLRSTVVITAVTSVLAIAAVIFAAMSIYATSFDSGRNTANEIQGVRQEFLEKQNRIDQSLQEINHSLKERSKAAQKTAD